MSVKYFYSHVFNTCHFVMQVAEKNTAVYRSVLQMKALDTLEWAIMGDQVRNIIPFTPSIPQAYGLVC